LETAAETGWALYELGHRHTLPTDAEAVGACAGLAARLLQRDATAFHLEAGRLCVLASRHRHACIVVARAGIPELLDAHPSAEPVHLGVPVKFPDGWEAHQAFMAHLAQHRVSAV
jgi:hypothetical protein